MPSFKVTLAERPSIILSVLGERPRSWAALRDCYGATSYDMDLLHSLGFIRQHSRGTWQITADGTAALGDAEQATRTNQEGPHG